MKKRRNYHLVGTPDLPITIGLDHAEKGMKVRAIANYHPEAEISLQVAGSTDIEIDGQTVTRQAGDIWIIPGGIPHRRIGYSEDAIVYWIVFSPKAITMDADLFFQKEFVTPLAEGRLEMPALLQEGHPCYETVKQAILQIKSCPLYTKNYKQKRLLILMQICLALMPYCHVKEEIAVIPENAPEGVKQCMRYIHNRYHTKLTLQDIAKHCYLHPNRLSAIFREFTGQSVFEYLTRFRIETAAGLLKREDLTAGKVAELVGFRSECLFYRKFKEIMGVTPKAYAKSHKKE